MSSLRARLALLFLGLAVSSSNGFALDPKPDLVVLVFGSGPDARPITAPGQPFSFRIGLDNMNAADANHVRLTAVLPNGLKFQTSDPAPTRVETGNHLMWEMETLDPKSLPRFFEVTAETEAKLVPGSHLEISAEAECNGGNADPTHSRASEIIYVQPVGPHLVVSGATLDSVLLTAENPATFKVNVENIGNIPSAGNRLEATLPKGVKLDKADPKPAFSSGQAVTFNLGDLARAQSKAVSMTVVFDSRQLPELLSNAPPLNFVFKASRVASGAEITDSHFEIVKHIESAGQDVAVWLMAEDAKEPGEASPKTDVTCVIKFANLGNEPAHKVVVALYLGSGLAIAHSDSQPTGTASDNAFPGGVARWDVGDLGVGMSRTIRSVIHATPITRDGAVVTATITADGIDLDTSNNTASLVRRNPLSPDILKSRQRSAAVVKPVGVSEQTTVRPVSHRWRHFFELILVIVAVVIFFHARRKS